MSFVLPALFAAVKYCSFVILEANVSTKKQIFYFKMCCYNIYTISMLLVQKWKKMKWIGKAIARTDSIWFEFIER